MFLKEPAGLQIITCTASADTAYNIPAAMYGPASRAKYPRTKSENLKIRRQKFCSPANWKTAVINGKCCTGMMCLM